MTDKGIPPVALTRPDTKQTKSDQLYQVRSNAVKAAYSGLKAQRWIMWFSYPPAVAAAKPK